VYLELLHYSYYVTFTDSSIIYLRYFQLHMLIYTGPEGILIKKNELEVRRKKKSWSILIHLPRT
jgi:hypothetical protein